MRSCPTTPLSWVGACSGLVCRSCQAAPTRRDTVLRRVDRQVSERNRDDGYARRLAGVPRLAAAWRLIDGAARLPPTTGVAANCLWPFSLAA